MGVNGLEVQGARALPLRSCTQQPTGVPACQHRVAAHLRAGDQCPGEEGLPGRNEGAMTSSRA
jgi:hypothetical protein